MIREYLQHSPLGTSPGLLHVVCEYLSAWCVNVCVVREYLSAWCVTICLRGV